MTETQFKTKVMNYLRAKYGKDIFLWKVCDNYTAGIPDLVCCIKTKITKDMVGESIGVYAAVELKFDKGKPTKLQLHTIDKIRNAGGIAEVCWTLEEIKELLKNLEVKK